MAKKPTDPTFPKQDLLLPPSLREWLPDDHLVYFVSDVVDQLKPFGDRVGVMKRMIGGNRRIIRA